jgi:hypothetical protein
LIKPVISRVKLKEENIKQFESFFTDKKNVNMSSYKSDNKTGLPVLYLQDHKQALWKKFHEQYPDGMQRSSFMTRLEGGRFQYKEDLGGLCTTCNECGYLVFAEIEKIMDANIIDPNIRVNIFFLLIYLFYFILFILFIYLFVLFYLFICFILFYFIYFIFLFIYFYFFIYS